MRTRHEPSMVHGFLESAGRIVEHPPGGVIFTQGDGCESVLYVQAGGVKLSVVAKSGREAVVAMLGPGDFFGEGCLVGQPVRLRQATAIMPSTIVVIEKDQMIRVLHEQSALSDRFIAHMLARNIRIEDDLVDQLFHSAEQRLARTLLLLAPPRQRGDATGTMPKVTQTTLGEMIGTTRSRVNAFMKHFERLGFIEFTTHELRVHVTLQAVVDGRDEQPRALSEHTAEADCRRLRGLHRPRPTRSQASSQGKRVCGSARDGNRHDIVARTSPIGAMSQSRRSRLSSSADQDGDGEFSDTCKAGGQRGL